MNVIFVIASLLAAAGHQRPRDTHTHQRIWIC